MLHYALDTRMLLVYAFAFIISFGLFSLLSQLYPNVRGQRLLRKGIRVDAIYWFLIPLIYVQISQWALVGISFIFFLNVLEARFPKRASETDPVRTEIEALVEAACQEVEAVRRDIRLRPTRRWRTPPPLHRNN